MGVATREVGKCRAPPDPSPGEGIPSLEVAVGGTAPDKVLELVGSLAVAGSLSATRTHAEEVVIAGSVAGLLGSAEEGTAMAKGSGSAGSLAATLTATRTHAEEVVMSGTVAALLGSSSGEKGSATAKGSGIADSLAPTLVVSEEEEEKVVAAATRCTRTEPPPPAKEVDSREKAVLGIGSISTPPTNYLEKCCVCDQPSGGRTCGQCTSHLRKSLLSVNLDEGCENMFYCLECLDTVQGDHTHREKTIPLLNCSGSIFAIVKGGESWSSLFEDVQSEPGCLRPLHPLQGDKCEVCFDVIASATQGPNVRYCTIECWLRGEAVVSFPTWWVADLVYEDYEAKQQFHVDAFCIDCHCFFVQSNSCHINHKWLAIEVDPQNNSSCILIPTAHFLEEAFQGIKDLAAEKTPHTKIRRLRIKDNSPRCLCCKTRIEVGRGQICSLACALPPKELKLQDERCSRCMLRIEVGDMHGLACARRSLD